MQPHPYPLEEVTERVAKSGYPRPETLERTYNETDLDRAVQAYRFFYPSVAALALWKGAARAGLAPNAIFGLLDAEPRHVGFTYDSDAPYGAMALDLAAGPVVVELPPGPLAGVALDLNQRWVADLGVPGPDAGQGGKHLLLPPDSGTELPAGFWVGRSSTNRALVVVRPLDGAGGRHAAEDAKERLRAIKARPLVPPADWAEPRWIDVGGKPHDTTPLAWEGKLDYWKALHEIVDDEPPFPGYSAYYGELAALGIEQGRRFAPDARLRRLLEEAARLGKAEMCAQAFADRRPDRVVWRDRKWEWMALRFEGGDFMVGGHLDLEARDKWFYQALGASPAVFRREAGPGTLAWLATRDRTGAYLDGARRYTLAIPRPVPCARGWSLTVYDAETRSQIQTKQQRASLRSEVELAGAASDEPAVLIFGPTAPANGNAPWIQTRPGKGWFAYLRLHGPKGEALDGAWKPDDVAPAE
jgi:hypothetical protein